MSGDAIAVGQRVKRIFCGAALAIISVLAGCMNPPAHDSARVGPFFRPTNQVGEPQLPANLHRVVVLPAAVGSVAPPESGAELDPIFITALQQTNRFEIVAINRDECARKFHVGEFSSTAALPHDFLAVLKREYAADAVLFIDVTVYKPYRPLAIGVRAKLATLEDAVRLLWTFDNVFSAADPAVANAARHFFLKSDRADVPADFTQGVLQSPSRFARYVAAEMFATLPPVYAPPPPPPAEKPSKVAEGR